MSKRATFTDLFEIQRSRAMLETRERVWIRQRGWVYTITPGNYWMFKKKIKGNTFLVEIKTAIRIETEMER